MSSHIVEVCTIDEVMPHPGADRLELVRVKGWICVTGKGNFQAGDLCIYIPIDSVLSDWLEKLLFPEGSKIVLSKRRIKTIKIRGHISQGMCIRIGDVFDAQANCIPKLGEDVAKVLGITKYDPPKKASAYQPGKKKIKVHENPHFRKYTDLENLKWFPTLFKEGELVHITEKIHGCLQAETVLRTATNEQITIREIVEKREVTEVLGLDASGQVVPVKILNYFDNGPCSDWLRVRFSRARMGRGNSFGSIICTPNHKFYLPETGEYAPISELSVGAKILCARSEHILSYVQKQVLIGKMLGDGSYANRAVVFSHMKSKEGYTDFTGSFLGDICGNRQKDQISGYGSVMTRGKSISSYAIEELFADWLLSGRKCVPESFKGQLAPISLAFWYMDDGSLSHHGDQEDRAQIATNGFDEHSIDILISEFARLGICAIKFNSNGWRLRLNSDSADILFSLIAPYVPQCMQYKLPERYRGMHDPLNYRPVSQYKPSTVIQEILSIDPVSKDVLSSLNTRRYDLETETHNFIADNVVVHNSNFRAGWVPFVAQTLWQKFKGIFGWNPKYEFVYGSRNLQLQHRIGRRKNTYYSTNVYWEAVEQYDLINKLDKGIVVYGEIYGADVQPGYSYGLNGKRGLALFDLYVAFDPDENHADGYSTPALAEAYFKSRGLPYVPVLGNVPFNAASVLELAKGASVLCPAQKIREGVVIRSCTEERKILKVINDNYLLSKHSDEEVAHDDVA